MAVRYVPSDNDMTSEASSSTADTGASTQFQRRRTIMAGNRYFSRLFIPTDKYKQISGLYDEINSESGKSTGNALKTYRIFLSLSSLIWALSTFTFILTSASRYFICTSCCPLQRRTVTGLDHPEAFQSFFPL